MTREEYDRAFHDYLGARNVIWLGHGIVGDDTHGHVDDLCRFVNRDTLVLSLQASAGIRAVMQGSFTARFDRESVPLILEPPTMRPLRVLAASK